MTGARASARPAAVEPVAMRPFTRADLRTSTSRVVDRVDRAFASFVAAPGDPPDGVEPQPAAVERRQLVGPALIGFVAFTAVALAATHRDPLFRGRQLLDWPVDVPF